LLLRIVIDQSVSSHVCKSRPGHARTQVHRVSNVQSPVRAGDKWLLAIGASSALFYLIIYLTGNWFSFAPLGDAGRAPDRRLLLLSIGGYYTAILLLFAAYAWLLRLVLRGGLTSTFSRRLGLMFPVIFNLVLLSSAPAFSNDTLNYLAYGYIANLPGGNPYLESATSIRQSSFGLQLAEFGWTGGNSTAYGPLWTVVAAGVVRLGSDARTALILDKTLLAAASLSAGAAIYWILGRVRPAEQLLGTVVYLWNPLVILEVARDGHNDALMVLTAVAALGATLSRRPTVGLLGAGVGMLLKYIPALLLPPLLVYIWRGHRDKGHRVVQDGLPTFVVALGLAILAYAPFSRGPSALDNLLREGQLSWTTPMAFARISLLFLIAVVASWRVSTAASLLQASAYIALAYLMVAVTGYWPWYAIFPIATMALSPSARFRWTVVVLSLGAELYAPANLLAGQHLIGPSVPAWSATIARGVPIMVFALLWASERFRLWPFAPRKPGLASSSPCVQGFRI
jgi:alpha-1,6-mannosyltransferase